MGPLEKKENIIVSGFLEELKEEISTTGLCFNHKDHYSVLLDLLNYMKDNYYEAKSLFYKIREIKMNGRLPELSQAIFQNSKNLFRIVSGNKIRKEYINFFNKIYGSSKSVFCNNLDRYCVLMFDIFKELDGKTLEERNQYLNKVIFNFNSLFYLGLNKVYIKLLSGDFHENIILDGHPEGRSKRIFPSGYLYYKEENFFTDGKVEDSYNGEYVDVEIQSPSFIIKNGRGIGYDFAFKEDFDDKYFEVTIYNLAFDASKLPSKEELENTRNNLATYDYMMKSKGVEHLKKQLEKLEIELRNTDFLLESLGFDDFSEFYFLDKNLLLKKVKKKMDKVLCKRRN